MYSLTTDTGLSFHTADPIDLGEALHAELTSHREGPVSYSITRDGVPQHDGWIVLSSSSDGSDQFIRDSVHGLVDAMIVQAAYETHAAQRS